MSDTDTDTFVLADVHAFGSFRSSAADERPVPLFRPALLQDGATVAIVLLIEAAGAPAAGRAVWATTYPTLDEATRRFMWLEARPAECTRLGRHAMTFGAGEITSEIEVGVEVDRIRMEKEAAKQAEQAQRDRAEAERKAAKAATISSWHVVKKKQFGFELQRGDEKDFWTILFREKWERDRFSDWCRWQKHRWAEWETFLQTHEPIELDRMVLAEMIETERRVKKEGLSAGGRRPLRFWRGEA